MQCNNCGFENADNAMKCRSCLKEIGGNVGEGFAKQNQEKYGEALSDSQSSSTKAAKETSSKKPLDNSMSGTNPPADDVTVLAEPAPEPEKPFADFFVPGSPANLAQEEQERYFSASIEEFD